MKIDQIVYIILAYIIMKFNYAQKGGMLCHVFIIVQTLLALVKWREANQ